MLSENAGDTLFVSFCSEHMCFQMLTLGIVAAEFSWLALTQGVVVLELCWRALTWGFAVPESCQSTWRWHASLKSRHTPLSAYAYAMRCPVLT